MNSPTPAGWTVTEQWTANRRKIGPGTELSITGVHGRYRFVRHVDTGTAVWIDVVDVARGRSRAFRPDRIKTVHRGS